MSRVAPDLPRPPREPARAPSFTFSATVEQLVLIASVYWALVANGPFYEAALAGRPLLAPATWAYAVALAVIVAALHVLLLGLVASRRALKPTLGVLIVCTAFATWFMQRYRVQMDPSMLRNVLQTDAAESRELLSTWSLLPHLLLYAVLPLVVLWRVRLVQRAWLPSLVARTVLLASTAVVLAATLLAAFQPFSAMVRNQKEARYLITPANYLWSLARVVVQDARGSMAPRKPIGLDAAHGPSWTTATRPALVVLVVGETARAANWGLSGYARQTTPQLARLPVTNFPAATACGTSTAVSLPCMFAPVGRRQYDESRIANSESLLHVLARAGVEVRWRDNQSGCKGVCEGLPFETVSSTPASGLCGDGQCFDEALLLGLEDTLRRAHGVQLLVLHMMGSHGPAYHRRYPKRFEHFRPACDEDDLARCTREQIVNAYDNSLLYTDQVLASLIRTLQAHRAEVDSAVIYASDHGESLGERNLFLHGMPYALAPDEQLRVPMLMWLSAGFEERTSLRAGCLDARASAPVAHDHLFHTLLGLLDVRTTLYDPAWDLLSSCRPGAADLLALPQP